MLAFTCVHSFLVTILKTMISSQSSSVKTADCPLTGAVAFQVGCMLLVLDLHLQQNGTIDRPPELLPLFGSIDPVNSFRQAVMMKSLG